MLEEPKKQFSRFRRGRCEKDDGNDGDGDDDFAAKLYVFSSEFALVRPLNKLFRVTGGLSS